MRLTRSRTNDSRIRPLRPSRSLVLRLPRSKNTMNPSMSSDTTPRMMLVRPMIRSFDSSAPVQPDREPEHERSTRHEHCDPEQQRPEVLLREHDVAGLDLLRRDLDQRRPFSEPANPRAREMEVRELGRFEQRSLQEVAV